MWTVTAIKVHAAMGDACLERLKRTWVAAIEVAKKPGQIEDYHIDRSDLAESGSFNLPLIVKYKKSDALAPSKVRYEAFMKVGATSAERRASR